MNNLYRKIAITSVGIALGFYLGANKEAKAAEIILTPTTSFGISQSRDINGRITLLHNLNIPTTFLISYSERSSAFYEFNIANLPLAANTVISSAIFQVKFDAFHGSAIDIMGYRGNGQPGLSDGWGGSHDVYFSRVNPGTPSPYEDIFDFNISPSVTSFINELVSTNDAFAGLSIEIRDGGMALISEHPRLIITTVDVAEPVPEPTTIFGSAIALSLGGWLKRKKLSQQNKTTPQH